MTEIWMAYYSDWSEFAIFDDELKCHRFAVEHSMQVHRVTEGKGVREQVANWKRSS